LQKLLLVKQKMVEPSTSRSAVSTAVVAEGKRFYQLAAKIAGTVCILLMMTPAVIFAGGKLIRVGYAQCKADES
jgi:hypothetical protein